MRIRTTKPEFWKSQDIADLSREDRLLFMGLWSYVDDNGVGIDDHRLITADLFPLDEDQNGTREYVREGLATLSRGLLISRYTVAGKSYIYINTWERHQRVDKPNKPRYPLPPTEVPHPTSEDVPEDLFSASVSGGSLDASATPSPSGTEEQRNRGEEKDTLASLTDISSRRPKPPDPMERFAEFYAAYPRHVDRRRAEKAWLAAIRRKIDPQCMISAAQTYARAKKNTEAKYVKHPATWLNAGSYDDEPEISKTFVDCYGNVVARDPDPWGRFG